MRRVVGLELPARFGEPGAVLRELATTLQAHEGDLVLLPECALTGYLDAGGECDLRPFAEPAVRLGEELSHRGPHSIAAQLAELASRQKLHLVAPLIERTPNGFFNSMIGVAPDRTVFVHYRKRHPWFPERWVTPGELPYGSFELFGARFLLAICFDIHFVAAEVPALLQAADVLLFPSAWVDDGRADLRGPIFRKLAASYNLTIVNANWGPGAPLLRGQGRSRIVTAQGETRFIEPNANAVVLEL
jgi:predicted amidohydrolase